MKVNSTMYRCDHSGFLGRNHLIKCVPQGSYYVMCGSEKPLMDTWILSCSLCFEVL